MRCKRFQCFTMCFSMFHKFAISEGGQTEMFYKCFSMFYVVFFNVLRMCHECAANVFNVSPCVFRCFINL